MGQQINIDKKHSQGLLDFYDNYDYVSFWQDRAYEDQADRMAVVRLLALAKKDRDCFTLIDIGAGPGRMVPLYEKVCQRFILLDSSVDQLKTAQEKIKEKKRSKLILANAQEIPLPNASCDIALCIRVSHHISDPQPVFKEVNRILQPNGYFILEIANKFHIKNRIKLLFKNDGNNFAVNRSTDKQTSKKDIVFINHNPKEIVALLNTNGFEIIETLSVSNFRSVLIKKIFPISFLVFLERHLQKNLAPFWFGPSIYFLAKKIS